MNVFFKMYTALIAFNESLSLFCLPKFYPPITNPFLTCNF